MSRRQSPSLRESSSPDPDSKKSIIDISHTLIMEELLQKVQEERYKLASVQAQIVDQGVRIHSLQKSIREQAKDFAKELNEKYAEVEMYKNQVAELQSRKQRTDEKIAATTSSVEALSRQADEVRLQLCTKFLLPDPFYGDIPDEVVPLGKAVANNHEPVQCPQRRRIPTASTEMLRGLRQELHAMEVEDSETASERRLRLQREAEERSRAKRMVKPAPAAIARVVPRPAPAPPSVGPGDPAGMPPPLDGLKDKKKGGRESRFMNPERVIHSMYRAR